MLKQSRYLMPGAAAISQGCKFCFLYIISPKASQFQNAIISANVTETVISSYQHLILGWTQTPLRKPYDLNIQPSRKSKLKIHCHAVKNLVAKFQQYRLNNASKFCQK